MKVKANMFTFHKSYLGIGVGTHGEISPLSLRLNVGDVDISKLEEYGRFLCRFWSRLPPAHLT